MKFQRWNIVLGIAIAGVLFAGLTQREKPVVAEAHAARVTDLERAVAAHPESAEKLRELAHAYVLAHVPGMAISVIEQAAPSVQQDPGVEFVYARALVDQGRSADALVVERRVVTRCRETKACSEQVVVAAERYVRVLEELGRLGVDDATANPEASNVAYINATRPVGYSAE